jgi:signal transduction histidine kinase/integral membrane sensor domain MASE1
LAGAGLLVVFVASMLAGGEEGLWLPSLGLGIALVAWLGLRFVPLLALAVLTGRALAHADQNLIRMLGDSVLLAAEMGLSWWLYANVARGTRRLEDPRSAAVFLLLVPGAVAASMASVQALYWGWNAGTSEPFLKLAGGLWISRALGILTLTPVLLVVVTPFLVRQRLIHSESAAKLPGGNEPRDWTWGEFIETGGLCMGAGLLAGVLVTQHISRGLPGWSLWGFSLLLVVWAGLRQGLRGGSLVAATSGVLALVLAGLMRVSVADFSPLQGNLLAQCSTALLVGASAGWIRASEARYRQMVGHMPVVLYSARMPRSLDMRTQVLKAGTARTSADADKPSPASGHLPSGHVVAEQAEVTLVSPACQEIFHASPEDMLGPYTSWLERIDPADRELVIAALAQLCLQKLPVVCEYRIKAPVASSPDPTKQVPPVIRWVRDTMVAYHAPENSLSGWEGVIEDITERRSLAQSLRRTNGMLQALVTYLPTGVFFVQGPIGQPILVNQRARQLLGRREETSAGLAQLSHVYRLHRPDGSPYPEDELPVAKALRLGTTNTANDIVVHRPDGRRVPLITWAAPVDWTGMGNPDAAVWVLEDLTALQQAESARRESEVRLRGVIETMAEGVVVQNHSGAIVECNPAACAILGLEHDQLIGRPSLGQEQGCLREDGSPFPRAEQPDLRALQDGKPVRNVIMGVPVQAKEGQPRSMRWIFVNSMPLPATSAGASEKQGARVVTTFADISAHRQTLEELQRAQRLELVGKLAGGTVHDFNNLLTVMIGLAGLAQTRLPGDHPAQQDLLRLMEAGEQAGHLAGQMLAFSKQRKPASHGDLRIGVDLNTVVIHSLKLLKGSMPVNILVEQRLEAGTLMVHADETQLKQVVMNLCLNAREAMEQGGTLTVCTEKVKDDRANERSGGEAAAGWVKLVVQDTGHGIDPAIQEHVFEPFFSTKEHGTGLGLAVVRQIVEGAGGRIQISSTQGAGTRMEVWLRDVSVLL